MDDGQIGLKHLGCHLPDQNTRTLSHSMSLQKEQEGNISRLEHLTQTKTHADAHSMFLSPSSKSKLNSFLPILNWLQCKICLIINLLLLQIWQQLCVVIVIEPNQVCPIIIAVTNKMVFSERILREGFKLLEAFSQVTLPYSLFSLLPYLKMQRDTSMCLP